MQTEEDDQVGQRTAEQDEADYRRFLGHVSNGDESALNMEGADKFIERMQSSSLGTIQQLKTNLQSLYEAIDEVTRWAENEGQSPPLLMKKLAHLRRQLMNSLETTRKLGEQTEKVAGKVGQKRDSMGNWIVQHTRDQEQAAHSASYNPTGHASGVLAPYFGYRPGKAPGLPAGSNIRPATLLKRMQSNFRAIHPDSPIPDVFNASTPGYIPYYIRPATGDIVIPGGWSGARASTIPMNMRLPFSQQTVDRLQSISQRLVTGFQTFREWNQ